MSENLLRRIPLFAGLAEADLERLAGMVDSIEVPAGELLFEEGQPGDRAYVIQRGRLEVFKASAGREVLLAQRGPGEVIGEIALIEDRPRMASVRAEQDSTLLAITKQQLQAFMDSSPQASRAVFDTVLRRLRSTQSQLEQAERLARLGVLTAGIAHELNNPAAAVKRSSVQLRAGLAKLAQLELQLYGSEPQPELRSRLAVLDERARAAGQRPPEMNALQRSDQLAALEGWLEDMGVARPWEIAPELVDLAVGEDELRALGGQFTALELPVALAWWAENYRIYGLLYELEAGAGRISSIVSALKSYVYLDQAPVQSVDIHRGLDDTLIILNSKIKNRPGLSIDREYDPALPHIYGYGSELNQVWTNLVDNALDAVGQAGHITIRTRADGDWVIVQVEDDGAGIPSAIRERIFEPFFTTKPAGAGAGMGLDISRNIVVQKHHGQITAESEPGCTRFEVRLPVDFSRAGPPAG